MSKETEGRSGLPSGARWAAVAVLGISGVAGILRAWVVAPPRMLDPRPGAPGLRAPAPAAEPGVSSAPEPETVPAPPGVTRRVNVNTASAAELDLLPGIGPALAAMIIEDRQANGPYATLDDLDRVPRIGPKTIARLAPYATAE